MTNEQAAIAELEADLAEMVADIQRVHRLGVHLSAAAIAYHVEAAHEGCWLALPEGTRCQDEQCLEFSEQALECDAWLADKRDFLDIKIESTQGRALHPMWLALLTVQKVMAANAGRHEPDEWKRQSVEYHLSHAVTHFYCPECDSENTEGHADDCSIKSLTSQEIKG